MRALILGGTSEARELAAALTSRPGWSVVSSLAGRVRRPALPVGETVIGGFGGASGLAAFLRERQIDLMIDATHPFAATISANAVTAAGQSGTPLFVLERPGWHEQAGDRWFRVADLEQAAAQVFSLCPAGAVVFVTAGRRELAPFTGDPDRHYLIRAVDPPEVVLPPEHTLVLDRGPYDLASELGLMRRHGVAVLVTKDSGGDLTRAKLDAARRLGLPVVMVDRPGRAGGPVEVARSVDDLLGQLAARSG